MEMLKLLNDAKANGLSKEEFFQLIDLELRMNESKKQTSGAIMSSGDGLSSGNAGLEKLLRETCQKMDNQQKQQHQMFVETLDKQQQYLQLEFQHFQKQLLQQQDVQLKQHQHITAQQNEQLKYSLQGKGDLSGKSQGSLDPALLDMKDKFHEMRNTVLNRLEEEKVFMRDALSKAQNDILTLLTQTGQEMSHIKEAVGADEIAQIGKQVSQIRLFCEEQTNERSRQGHQDESTEGAGPSHVIQDSLKTLLEDLMTKIEDKLDKSVDSLKQEVKEMKEAQSTKLPDEVVQGGGMQDDDNSVSYYFCINNFHNCVKYEESIDNNQMYVDQLHVHVKGYVQFVRGEMEVWISYVNNPKADYSVQSLAAPPGEIIVKAAIVDVTGKLPGKDIGEKSFSGNTLFHNSECPFLIGRVKCDEIVTDGYVLNGPGAVLLKYAIFVQDSC